jgi:hypothetical protein
MELIATNSYNVASLREINGGIHCTVDVRARAPADGRMDGEPAVVDGRSCTPNLHRISTFPSSASSASRNNRPASGMPMPAAVDKLFAPKESSFRSVGGEGYG